MTPNNIAIPQNEGILGVSFMNSEGSLNQFFSSVSQHDACSVFASCVGISSGLTPMLASKRHKDDTKFIISSSDGGDDMEQRLSILETKVSHIEAGVSDLKASLSKIDTTLSSIDKGFAVMSSNIENISCSISKMPTSDSIDKKISEAKVSQILWTIGSMLTLISIATGIIIKTLHI